MYNYLWRITTCITTHLITYLINRYLCHKCSGIVYIRETGRRLGDHLERHRLDVIKEKVAPPVPSRFSSRDHRLVDVMVAIIKVGREELEKKR